MSNGKNAVKNLKSSTLKINITEYEQLAVYFDIVARSAVYDRDIISNKLLYCLSLLFMDSDDYTLIEKACLVSKEFEYCSENIDLLLDFLQWSLIVLWSF